MQWDAEQYERFKRERELPFEDLFALIRPRDNMRVIDLGCGTGELTKKLQERLHADVLGLDSSAEMLAKAPVPTVHGSIEQFADGSDEYDLVFSHAALHWIPDHATLIPKLLQRTKTGGQLAVQMPSNHQHRAALIIAEVAGWRRESPLLSIAEYADLLWAHGGRNLTVFEKVYCHEMPDADAILEWVRGTALLPYLERLGEADRPAFVDEVRARYRREFSGGPLLFGFRRTLFAATRV
jgi:trans-aconitate 2-methyltransferase